MIAPRRARPILAWVNVGTLALVLIAAVDLHLLVLALLGVTGYLFYGDLDRSERWQPAVAALLGVGLLFLGLRLMRTGANELRAFDSVVNSWHSRRNRSSRHLLRAYRRRSSPNPRRWRSSMVRILGRA